MSSRAMQFAKIVVKGESEMMLSNAYAINAGTTVFMTYGRFALAARAPKGCTDGLTGSLMSIPTPLLSNPRPLISARLLVGRPGRGPKLRFPSRGQVLLDWIHDPKVPIHLVSQVIAAKVQFSADYRDIVCLSFHHQQPEQREGAESVPSITANQHEKEEAKEYSAVSFISEMRSVCFPVEGQLRGRRAKENNLMTDSQYAKWSFLENIEEQNELEAGGSIEHDAERLSRSRAAMNCCFAGDLVELSVELKNWANEPIVKPSVRCTSQWVVYLCKAGARRPTSGAAV